MSSFDDMHTLWHTTSDAPPSVGPERLAALRADAARLDRTLRWRDAREVVAAGVGAAVFAGFAALQPDARAQALTMVGVCVWIGAVLLGVRLRRPRAGLAAPLAQALRAERDWLGMQARLLRWAWAWYVAPIAAATVWYTSADGTSPLTLAVVAVGSVGLGWLNWRAGAELAARRDAVGALLDG